jgi:hypothetical protein
MKLSQGIWPALRVFFGIFMVCVYFAMAYLMLINFFKWGEGLDWFRYLLAVVFAVYGIYRAYRQVKGTDYYRLKDSKGGEEAEEESRIDIFIKEQRNQANEKRIDNTIREQDDEK